MSLFFKPSATAEERAVTTVEWGTGADLDNASASEAISVVPVFAACRLLSDSVATLPMQAFTKSGETRQPITLPAIFDTDTRIEWLQQAVMSLALWGNAYGYVVQRDGVGNPADVRWLNPEKVVVDETGAVPIFRHNGAEISRVDLKHIPLYAMPGTVVGLSPIKACALLTTTGAATQKMMSDWFKGRAVPGVTLQNTEKTLDPEQAAAVSNKLRARLKNGQPFVYGKDWSVDVLKMPAEDAGFVASAKLNATQVASIYGIPPEMIGGETGSSLTYTTVELNSINFAQFTLRPWLAKLEQEFSGWMPKPRRVRFNVDAMIRVDTKTRYEVHKIGREIGLENIDEQRALEDRPPLPDGQGQDFTPLPKIAVEAPKETP